ncbi:MAG TPA: hypothetical protein VF538_16165 [Pyrinomonadaceae bacterium]
MKQIKRAFRCLSVFKELSVAEYGLITYMLEAVVCGRLAQIEQVAVDKSFPARFLARVTDFPLVERESLTRMMRSMS